MLNFTNKTFGNFFLDELGVNIYEDRWAAQGNSKANRLRCYLRKADHRIALQTLNALWEYRERSSVTADYQELDNTVYAAYLQIVERLGGTPTKSAVPAEVQQEQGVDTAATSELADRLIKISRMNPQARGYAFESFLKDVFDVYRLDARASFRLKGEQIDGSFMLSGHTYLLEARWRNAKAGVDTLNAFNSKVEGKSDWSRGLIISQSGFTEDGLHAFGRVRSVICMDGLDLHEVLSGRLHLAHVIALKVRRAAETGKAYVPVRDLNVSVR